MVATYNSSLQAINLSAIDQPSVLRFSEPAHDNFWFEADLRLNSDAIGQRHIGLWMCTGQSTQGYRFAHASGNWSVSRFDADFQDGALVGPLVRDGDTPIAGLTGLAPSFNPGQRWVLRCECVVGAWDSQGTPRARVLRFFAGGVQICVVDDVTYPGALIPGVCLQGATARIESIAGGAPSTLAALGSQVGLRSMSELRQLASPCGESWDQVGGPGAKRFGLPMLRRNIHFGGDGFITGTIKEKGNTGQADQPLERQVLLMSDNTRTLVAQTWSDALGRYRFDTLDPAQTYTVICEDHQRLYRAVIADRLRPTSTER
ncbi:hypothetical protein [Rhodoferax sp.]|uniref:hypothetical protein n=1 Tax=Rhodoferax sp. TaxID=50421 RepID=UPI0025D20604|nr:hypothetical protein [Rhodoferax sp.]